MKVDDFTFLIVPAPTVTLSNDPTGAIGAGFTVTLTCTVTMNQAVRESDLSLLMVEASLTRPDGTMLSLLNPVISGTTFTFTTRLSPFGRSDAGNYICMATVRPQPSISSDLTASNTVTSQSLNLVYSSKVTLKKSVMNDVVMLYCRSVPFPSW